MKLKLITVSLAALVLLAVGFQTAQAVITPPPVTEPTTTGECKNDGWRNFGDMFKTQGDCVSFVVTNGRNAPDGPPNH